MQRAPSVRSIFPVAVGLLLAALSTGCATGTSLGYQIEARTAAGLDAAAKAFEVYDHDQQLAIVKRDVDAGRPQSAEPDLTAYRSRRATVNKALADASAILLVGKTLLPLVGQGLAKSSDLDAWMQSLLKAAQAVQQAITTFETGAPPPGVS